MAKSKPINVRGWLLFFVIVFVLSGIGEVSLFFYALGNGMTKMDQTWQLVFGPILAIGFLGSAWLLWSKNKAALTFVYLTLFASALFSTLAIATTSRDMSGAEKVTNGVSSIAMSGLLALYFKNSKRVKDTLN